MLVFRRFGEVGQQQILLCHGQCLTAVGFKLVCLFQLPQNIVRRIAPQIAVLHRHVQHLMQNRVYAVNRRDLQAPLVCQRVVELLHIRLFERRHLRFAEIRLHELPIKVQIILKGVVLQAALDLCPQGEHIVQGDVPCFCLDAFQRISPNVVFLFPKLLQGRGINRMSLAIRGSPTEIVLAIFALGFAFAENHTRLVLAFRILSCCHERCSFLHRGAEKSVVLCS